MQANKQSRAYFDTLSETENDDSHQLLKRTRLSHNDEKQQGMKNSHEGDHNYTSKKIKIVENKSVFSENGTSQSKYPLLLILFLIYNFKMYS